MKKILSLLLAFVILATMFAGCGKKNAEPTTPQIENVKLWYGYNTERFMQDYAYTEEMESRDSTLRMYGIRGDVESIQLMITPENDVTAYQFEVNDLVNTNGKKIGKSHIEAFAQWYVYVDESYNTSAGYGYYPDALVPMAAMKRTRNNTISAGMNQGIWLNVTIPEEAEAGVYTGVAELKLDNQVYEIPMELTVYDATMPEEVHIQSCFLIWYDYMLQAEGSNSGAMAQAYFDLLVEKRVMPMYPESAITGNYDAFVNWVITNVAENPKISSYGLPYGIENDENGKRIVSRSKAMELLTILAKRNVELRQSGKPDINLFEKAYYYLGGIIDEPTGEAVERVRICDLILTECKFAVAEEYLKDYPDLYDTLIGLNHIVTTAYTEELLGSDTEGGVHTWCPQFQFWHTQTQRDQYYERKNTTDRQMGEGIWWYGCNNPAAPFPTYHLDDDLIASRVLSWMQYDYGCEGNLYWCVNCSSETMWETAHNYGGAVGEGNLTYPASKFDLDTPMATLRLESIREGCEDYEYFWMIENMILQYNAQNGTNYDPEDLMAPLYEGLYNGMTPTRGKPELFLERRIAVLEILQTMTADPAAGIAALQSK